ncbi:MAG: twin-arginine translocation signal domain-containing protein, partial [Alphaproteobacteria bacterium]|nr:twin-arginine translocation signal domain-containing protein [Alphaproteobacteria bacterium]
MSFSEKINRRGFLRRTSAAGAAVAAGPLVMGKAPGGSVALVLDNRDPIVATPAVQNAANTLQQALTAAGYKVQRTAQAERADSGFCIVAAGADDAAPILQDAQLTLPSAAESLALLPTGVAGKPATLACGRDARGLSYALLELADRVRHGATLTIAKPIVERPGNPVRSIMRQFTSEVLDKPWFYDRQMWPRYLDMLAAQRFNRLNLSFGLGYDQLKNVTDSYFLFLYPFLVAAPGYDVRVTNLSNAERDKNLDT